MLFDVFCEPDFDEILLLQTASRPEPQFQIVWKMQQKPIFPKNDKLEPSYALQTPLLSAQQAGTLTTYPGEVDPRTTPCLWLLGRKHEAVKTLSLPGTAGQSFKLGRGLCKMRSFSQANLSKWTFASAASSLCGDCAVPGLTWLQPTDLWEVNIWHVT